MDNKTINNIVVDYTNTITRSFAFLLDEEDRLLSSNLILGLCIHFSVTTADKMVTTEAAICCYFWGPSVVDLQEGGYQTLDGTEKRRLVVWSKTISPQIQLIHQRNFVAVSV